jgi:hypothetical protein
MPDNDLTTMMTAHLEALRDANALRTDTTSLFRANEPTIVAATDERADKNTQYFEYFKEN